MQFLLVHAVLGLGADESAFGGHISLFRLRVGTFQPVQLYGSLDAAERDDRILAIHFHYFAHRGLALYSDVAAGGDGCKAFCLFPRLLFCQSLGRQSVLFSFARFLFLFPVLLLFQLFHFAGDFFFQFLVGKRFH